MKTKRFCIGIAAVIGMLAFSSCENDLFDRQGQNNGILPDQFKVDIPVALSNNLKTALLKSSENDTLSGNHIYWYLNAFIAVGEVAADVVEATIWAISAYKIENVISLSYTSRDDDRVKNLVVTANATFQDRLWDYQLTITDAESEGHDDAGMGMQIFWNEDPIEGVAIYKPFNLNRKKHTDAPDAMASISYSSVGTGDYDACMTVEIVGLPVSASRIYEVESLKMFVGRKGQLIDVIGNSNHPNAYFNPLDPESKGYNWAFAASGDAGSNIAVAEVGLPFSSADVSSRTSILVDNSIKNVLTREMTNFIVTSYANHGITLQPLEIANFLSPYLKNAEAPGYFNASGFVAAGSAPNANYSILETRVENLTPYNPSEISNLVIDFKEQ
jgi:hypothetical protein